MFRVSRLAFRVCGIFLRLFDAWQYAPEQRVAGARPELTKAAANASWLKRQKFSWELVSVLRKGGKPQTLTPSPKPQAPSP